MVKRDLNLVFIIRGNKREWIPRTRESFAIHNEAKLEPVIERNTPPINQPSVSSVPLYLNIRSCNVLWPLRSSYCRKQITPTTKREKERETDREKEREREREGDPFDRWILVKILFVVPGSLVTKRGESSLLPVAGEIISFRVIAEY